LEIGKCKSEMMMSPGFSAKLIEAIRAGAPARDLSKDISPNPNK
jgi:hypothetical protein